MPSVAAQSTSLSGRQQGIHRPKSFDPNSCYHPSNKHRTLPRGLDATELIRHRVHPFPPRFGGTAS